VGPPGEEIYTDEFGRVKVQFHWDRYGENNENSSCWVRISSPWAGKTWGAIHLPRIGQEVIVSFEEGDPDRPLITGRVYNADNMPPYELPANATQSGIKSRSSKGGTGDNFNEIRFEDKKGSEEVYIHAEKDQNNVVENDETTDVGNDRTEDIGNDETISIGNNLTVSVTQASKQKAKSVLIKAADFIELKVGSSSIKLTPSGIVIKATKVDVKGSAMVVIKGGLTKIN